MVPLAKPVTDVVPVPVNEVSISKAAAALALSAVWSCCAVVRVVVSSVTVMVCPLTETLGTPPLPRAD